MLKISRRALLLCVMNYSCARVAARLRGLLAAAGLALGVHSVNVRGGADHAHAPATLLVVL